MAVIFETDRLIIRDWIPIEDAEQALQIYGDPAVMRFLGEVATSVEAIQVRLQNRIQSFVGLKNGTGFWAIQEKATGEIVGASLLKQLPDNDGHRTDDYEIGWHLRRSAWGKGYATESGRGAIVYGFETLKLPILYAVVHPDNLASMRVTQRLGMTPLGRSRQYYGLELELFQLTAAEYDRSG